MSVTAELATVISLTGGPRTGKTNDQFSRRSSSVPLKPPPCASPFATDDVFRKDGKAMGGHKMKYKIDSPFATHLTAQKGPPTASTRASSSMSQSSQRKPKQSAGRYLASSDGDSERDGFIKGGNQSKYS